MSKVILNIRNEYNDQLYLVKHTRYSRSGDKKEELVTYDLRRMTDAEVPQIIPLLLHEAVQLTAAFVKEFEVEGLDDNKAEGSMEERVG